MDGTVFRNINIPSIMRRQTSIAAKAPILSRRICSSFSRSQFAPVYPEAQKHVYLSALSLLMHVPPFRHGLSKHSLRSSQPFPSGVTRCPRGHLLVHVNVRNVISKKQTYPYVYCFFVILQPIGD